MKAFYLVLVAAAATTTSTAYDWDFWGLWDDEKAPSTAAAAADAGWNTDGNGNDVPYITVTPNDTASTDNASDYYDYHGDSFSYDGINISTSSNISSSNISASSNASSNSTSSNNTSSSNSSIPDVSYEDYYYNPDEEADGGKDLPTGLADVLQKAMDFFSNAFSPSVPPTLGNSSSSDEANLESKFNETTIFCDTLNSTNCTSASPEVKSNEDGSQYNTSEGENLTDVGVWNWMGSNQPTWIDASPSCLVDSLRSAERVSCLSDGGTAEVALAEVFSDEVIRKLMEKCPPGTWCLHRKHWRHDRKQTMQRVCDLLPCLDDWKGVEQECQLSYDIRSALELLCNLTKADVSVSCFNSVRKMSHVLIADAVRPRIQSEDEGSFCTKPVDQELCIGACKIASNDLHCMCASCEHDMNLFQGFRTWQWLFQMSNAEERCQLNSSDCTQFGSDSTMLSHEMLKDPFLNNPRQLLKMLVSNEWQLIAGLSLSVVFSLFIVCIIFVSLRCNRKRRLRRRMRQSSSKSPLYLDDSYARDRIQYTIINTQPDDDDDDDDVT